MSLKLRPALNEAPWTDRRELSPVEAVQRARTHADRVRASLAWALVEHASTLEKLAK